VEVPEMVLVSDLIHSSIEFLNSKYSESDSSFTPLIDDPDMYSLYAAKKNGLPKPDMP